MAFWWIGNLLLIGVVAPVVVLLLTEGNQDQEPNVTVLVEDIEGDEETPEPRVGSGSAGSPGTERDGRGPRWVRGLLADPPRSSRAHAEREAALAAGVHDAGDAASEKRDIAEQEWAQRPTGTQRCQAVHAGERCRGVFVHHTEDQSDGTLVHCPTCGEAHRWDPVGEEWVVHPMGPALAEGPRRSR